MISKDTNTALKRGLCSFIRGGIIGIIFGAAVVMLFPKPKQEPISNIDIKIAECVVVGETPAGNPMWKCDQ